MTPNETIKAIREEFTCEMAICVQHETWSHCPDEDNKHSVTISLLPFKDKPCKQFKGANFQDAFNHIVEQEKPSDENLLS